MKDKFLLITKCLLNVMFYLGIPTTITIPWTLKWYSQTNQYYDRYYWIQTALFLICGTLACLIVFELRRMIKSVEAEDCFVEANVRSLRSMGNYSFMVSAATVVRLFLYGTPGVFVVLLVFAIAGLFSKVLAKVFAEAIRYKLDNDLTI
ncbi:MAG TPA: DUF2975 domain-containing protein [Lachnospiraceae bacterium]|nr:DUF2975 domain-containing protein [Lachnospiraceae bacterium]